MMKKVFTYVYLSFSLLIAEKGSFEKGVAFYDSRSKGAVGYSVKPLNIENAIKQFKKASQNLELDAGVYLMRCYYFKGKFVANTDDEKKEVFSKEKKIGEKLIKLFPKSAAVRYWYLVNLGSWAEVYGTMAAAKEGVAGLMRDHSKRLLKLTQVIQMEVVILCLELFILNLLISLLFYLGQIMILQLKI